MEIYETEEQQWEAIKKWFNRYSAHLSWGVIVVALIVFGVRYWLHHQENIKAKASDQYIELLMNESKKDETSVKHQAHRIMEEFPKTPYAQMVALKLAKLAMQENNLAEAEKHLKWIMKNSAQSEFRDLAQVRLMIY